MHALDNRKYHFLLWLLKPTKKFIFPFSETKLLLQYRFFPSEKTIIQFKLQKMFPNILPQYTDFSKIKFYKMGICFLQKEKHKTNSFLKNEPRVLGI